MSRSIKVLSVLMVAGFTSFAAYIFFFSPRHDDPLCSIASSQFQMQCSILAAPGVYDRGAIVTAAEGSGVRKDKVGFPLQHLLGPSCLFEEEGAAFAAFNAQSSPAVVFGRRKVAVDRYMSAGGVISVPEAAGFDIKAGPNISEARSIVLSANSAQLFTIEGTAIQDLIQSCRIRASCLNKISSEHGIVTRFLVAKNLTYSVEDQSGTAFPLHVAIEKGMVNLGIKVGMDEISAVDLSSGQDMVFAVEAAKSTDFDLASCSSPIKILKISGVTKTSAAIEDKATEENVSVGDEESAAHVRYLLSDAERGPESITLAESFANGKWTVSPAGIGVDIDSTTLVIAGEKWPYGQEQLKTTYAMASAFVETSLDILIGNRADTSKELALVAELELAANRSVPFYHTFDKLNVVRSNGSVRNVSAVWNANDTYREFILDKLDAGELVRLQLTRKSKLDAHDDRSSGKMEETLRLRFELR